MSHFGGTSKALLSGYVPYTGGTANLNLTGYGGTFGSVVTPGTYLAVKSGSRTMTVGDFGLGATYEGISFADTPSGTNYSLLGDNSNTYLNAPTSGTIYYRIANSTYASLTTTLFTLSTANLKVNSSNPVLYLENSGANSATSGRLEFRSSGGSEYAYQTFDASANAFRIYYGTNEAIRITSSGMAQFLNGGVSSPSISFSGDTNTGMYSLSSDSIGFACGGSEKLKINSNGIGINGNNPGGGGSWIATPSGLATDAAYGWSVQNAVDYVSTFFKAPDYSLGGGIYGDGLVNIISGQNFSNGGSGTPDITIQPGTNYTSHNAGNIYITGYSQVDGGSSTGIYINAGSSNSSNGGELQIHAGACTSSYSGGDLYMSAGLGSASGSAGYGNLYVDPGYDVGGSGAGGYVRILSYAHQGYLSFFGVSGTARVTTAISGASFSSPGAGSNVKTDDTFGGYTIAQLAQALLDYGLLS